MQTTVFFTSLILITISYGVQIYKMLSKHSAQGISLDAYYLTIVSLIIILITSTDITVQILMGVELFLVLLSVFFIFEYQTQRGVKKEFWIALAFSFLMIFGIAQSIKSFKENSSSVSISAYLIWGGFNCSLIYLSNDWYIQIPLVITNLLYLYIIFKAYKSLGKIF